METMSVKINTKKVFATKKKLGRLQKIVKKSAARNIKMSRKNNKTVGKRYFVYRNVYRAVMVSVRAKNISRERQRPRVASLDDHSIFLTF